MYHPTGMWTVHNRLIYNVDKSILLSGDDWFDGKNYERSGKNTFLYRTSHGRFFFANLTQRQGEHSRLAPCSEDEAINFWYSVPEGQRRVKSFEDAFPGVILEDA